MVKPFVVTSDEKRRMIRAVLRGFWDLPTTHAYLAALRGAAARASGEGARTWWLIDLGERTIQSREVAELMSAQLPSILPSNSVVAVVSPGALQAMQAKRVVADETHRYFANAIDAEAWLDAQGRPA